MPQFATSPSLNRSHPRHRRTLAAFAMSAAAAALPACVDINQRDARVELRDTATGNPVPDAAVEIEILEPVHPFRVGDYLRKRPGDSFRTRTGPGGTARVRIPTDRPMKIVLVFPGALIDSLYFPGSPIDSGPTEWMPLAATAPALTVDPARPDLARSEPARPGAPPPDPPRADAPRPDPTRARFEFRLSPVD